VRCCAEGEDALLGAAFLLIAPSATNYVNFTGAYITVPAYSAGTVALYTGIGGINATLASQAYVNVSNAAAQVWLYMPRRSVWPNVNPAVEPFPLLGTNTLLTVKQTVTSTNAWAFQIMVEQ
jgi:hypothetical protein